MATIPPEEAQWIRDNHNNIPAEFHLRQDQLQVPTMYLVFESGYQTVQTRFTHTNMNVNVGGHMVSRSSGNMVFELTPAFQQHVRSAKTCSVTCIVDENGGGRYFLTMTKQKIFV